MPHGRLAATSLPMQEPAQRCDALMQPDTNGCSAAAHATRTGIPGAGPALRHAAPDAAAACHSCARQPATVTLSLSCEAVVAEPPPPADAAAGTTGRRAATALRQQPDCEPAAQASASAAALLRALHAGHGGRGASEPAYRAAVLSAALARQGSVHRRPASCRRPAAPAAAPSLLTVQPGGRKGSGDTPAAPAQPAAAAAAASGASARMGFPSHASCSLALDRGTALGCQVSRCCLSDDLFCFYDRGEGLTPSRAMQKSSHKAQLEGEFSINDQGPTRNANGNASGAAATAAGRAGAAAISPFRRDGSVGLPSSDSVVEAGGDGSGAANVGNEAEDASPAATSMGMARGKSLPQPSDQSFSFFLQRPHASAFSELSTLP